MKELQYVGETLWIGYACKALIYTGFLSALFSTIAYFTSTFFNKDKDSWKSLGNKAFYLHGFSVVTLLVVMFSAMLGFKYEYSYVFEHVSADLPTKYIFSAFWEGQEGGFLLWMFWHIILGFVLIKKEKPLGAPVMAVIALAEVWLNSMLLGVFINDIKIGSNPMTLMRDMVAAPIFSNADYLSLIKGRGLNPLLQNYWMTIHPPFVFFGFALTIVPFAYAFAALATKSYDEWLRPAMRWGLLSAGILGIAILMGSLWAYEALSFGGYWAWDPVENTSLVPWIILVAGVHTNLTALSSNHGRKATIFFYLGGFILIVYSTLLTRSGILGDTSAHAFTEMGLEWQLTFFIFTFILLALGFYIARFKGIFEPAKEESIHSREFWMFVGSLVLMFSGLLINGSSSIPVYNKIMRVFDPSFVGNVLKDPIEHYNKFQIWIAIFVGILSGLTVWTNYRSSKMNTMSIWVRMGVHVVLSIAFTYLTTLWIKLPLIQHLMMCFASWFTIFSNLDYIISRIKANNKVLAAGSAHLGFGLMGIGILATGLNFTHLNNPFMFKGLFEEGDEEKYVQLIKNQPLILKNYMVTYEKDTLIDKARFYDLSFKELNQDLTVKDSFKTRPNAVYSNDFTKIAAYNPDTRHYGGKDIFTCVVQLPAAIRDVEEAKQIEDSTKYTLFNSKIGDTIKLASGVKIVPKKVQYRPTHSEYITHDHTVGFGLEYILVDSKDKELVGNTAIGIDGNILYKYPGVAESEGIRIRPSEKYIDQLLTAEDKLNYKTFKVKQGVPFMYEGNEIILATFDKKIDSSKFEVKPNDVAIAAVLQIKNKEDIYVAKPIFILRGNNPLGVKDYTPEVGLHTRLSFINPQTNEFELKIAKDIRDTNIEIPLEIATDVPRTDYIILEAKIFPGINLFWVGSILMMFGLLVAWYNKWKSRV
jgi:cytochrome c-type biogenesis protein CcmF